jgi:hypothetical protein
MARRQASELLRESSVNNGFFAPGERWLQFAEAIAVGHQVAPSGGFKSLARLRKRAHNPAEEKTGMKPRYWIPAFAAAIGVILAAESPFIGRWKLNPGKSQLAGITTTIEQLPSGEMQLTSQGLSYRFKLDGKEYPAFWGMTACWRQVDSSTWETIYQQGAMTTTSVTKISPDGKTMTVKSTGKKPNGEDFQETATSARVSGGPGLAGKWKSTNVQVPTQSWEISANGDDGLTMRIVDYDAVCSVKFDGKDNQCTGPTMPKGFTISARRTGPRTLRFTEKIDGKVLFSDVFTVSADGKTMVDDSSPTGSKEKMKLLYDKQ